MVQMMPAAGSEPVRIRHLGEEVVIGVPDAIEEQAEQRHCRQRPEAEIMQQHGQQDHVAQHQGLDGMEAVGGERRRHDRTVMRQMKSPQRLGVEQPVVDPEMHVVPGHQHQDFDHYLLPAGIRVQVRPPQLQQAPREAPAGTEPPARQPRLGELAAQLAWRQRPRVQRTPHAQRRQHVLRQQPGRRAEDQIDAAKKQQPRQHYLPGGQGFKCLGNKR
ncbi:hypothetical protein G6F57_014387 [Rhizopus arrhizus]|nr:hypothetical protein G6F57_014387 [Rhizopus arrhizus]